MRILSFDSQGLHVEPISATLERALANTDKWRPHLERLAYIASYLKPTKPAVQLWGSFSPASPPTLTMIRRGTSIVLWADCYDRVLPEEFAGLHFRLQISREGSKLTRDVRTTDPVEVARQIRLAFSLHER